jgi:hypothetical protein
LAGTGFADADIGAIAAIARPSAIPRMVLRFLLVTTASPPFGVPPCLER